MVVGRGERWRCRVDRRLEQMIAPGRLRTPRKSGVAAAAIALALGGCGRHDAAKELNQLDAELVDNAVADPAVTSPLEDPVMTDPSLSQQSDDRALHHVPDAGLQPLPAPDTLAQGDAAPNVTGLSHTPAPAACSGDDCSGGPVTLGDLARLQATRARGAALPCAPRLAYSFAWAARLPPALPVYPQAQVAEAAGADTPGCHVRVVSFMTPAQRDAVTDYYYTRAGHAGFSAEHSLRGGDHVLAGARGSDAFYLILSDRAGGGTAVDMIVTTAR